jgi:transcriptional regulator with XRE-family HTH domain
MSSDNGLSGFSERLNQLCDEKKMPYRGRAQLLSNKFGVTREAARKWLKSLAYPTLAKRAEITAWAGVTDAWLMSGKGDKQPAISAYSDAQRQVLAYMALMTPEQQRLAVKLAAQLLDLDSSSTPEHPHRRATDHPMGADTQH